MLEPTQAKNHLSFNLNLKEGKLQISPQKLKMVKKWVGQVGHQGQFVMQKDGLNFGSGKKFFGGPSIVKGF